MPSLNDHRNESRPRLREKDPQLVVEEIRAADKGLLGDQSSGTTGVRRGLQSPSTKDDDRRGRAPPADGDPGSKGRRVAWTTSSGSRARRDRGRPGRGGRPLRRSPGTGMDGG